MLHFFYAASHRLQWQGRQDLNPQPAVLETAALPVELLPFEIIVFYLMRLVNADSAAGGAKKKAIRLHRFMSRPGNNFILELFAQIVKIITVTRYTDY